MESPTGEVFSLSSFPQNSLCSTGYGLPNIYRDSLTLPSSIHFFPDSRKFSWRKLINPRGHAAKFSPKENWRNVWVKKTEEWSPINFLVKICLWFQRLTWKCPEASPQIPYRESSARSPRLVWTPPARAPSPCRSHQDRGEDILHWDPWTPSLDYVQQHQALPPPHPPDLPLGPSYHSLARYTGTPSSRGKERRNNNCQSSTNRIFL